MTYLILLSVLLGLSMGSFSNAVIWRLRQGKSLIGRSECPLCKTQLKWFELIPILSFLIQKGRCRYCHKSISIEYPAVEAVLAILFSLSTYIIFPCFSSMCLFQIIKLFTLFTILTILFVYDLRFGELPDAVTITGIILIFVLSLGAGEIWWITVTSGALGAAFFALQWFLSRGKWVGEGDIRFGGLMGVSLSFPGLLYGLALSYLIGSVVSVILLLSGKKTFKSKIPLGPFLAIGTVVSVLVWTPIAKI